jgi:hypothetical protein
MIPVYPNWRRSAVPLVTVGYSYPHFKMDKWYRALGPPVCEGICAETMAVYVSLSQNPIKQSKAIGVGHRKNERNLI